MKYLTDYCLNDCCCHCYYCHDFSCMLLHDTIHLCTVLCSHSWVCKYVYCISWYTHLNMSSLYTYNPIYVYIFLNIQMILSLVHIQTRVHIWLLMDEIPSHRGRKSCWLILGRKDETTRMVVLVVSGWMRWVWGSSIEFNSLFRL